MGHLDPLTRAWQQVGIGLFFMLLAMIQAFAGKALAPSKFRSTWFLRKDNPRGFWLTVGAYVALGLFAAALGLPVILGYPAWG